MHQAILLCNKQEERTAINKLHSIASGSLACSHTAAAAQMGCGTSVAAPLTRQDSQLLQRRPSSARFSGAAVEAPSAAAPRSSSSSARGGKPQLNKSPSSLRTDAVKTHLRRRSVAIVTEMGVLNQSEAQALVGVMTVEELVQNVARLDRKRRLIAAMIKPPAKGGLLAPEADALVLALTSEEQQRTIERAGLAATDILHDEVKLRARASIALQHPKPALSIAEAVKHEPSALPKAELRARLLALEKLFSEEPEDEDAAGHIQAVWRGHHARHVGRWLRASPARCLARNARKRGFCDVLVAPRRHASRLGHHTPHGLDYHQQPAPNF